MQEAASSPSLSPSATAAGSDAVVMSAGEAGSEAGSEACHAPLDEHPTPRPDAQRPLTAQQIAEERAELDRLATAEEVESRKELLSDAAAAAVHEDESTSATEAELLAQQKAVWQAEEKANKERRREQEALHQAMFAYKQERIAAAQAEKDLLPYTMERVRLQKRIARDVAPSKALVQRAALEAAEAVSQNALCQQRLAQERDAAHTIARYYAGHQARQHYAALQRVRDEYLAAQQSLESNEGPVLVSERLRAVKAQNPALEVYQRKHIQFAPPPPTKQKGYASSSPEASAPSDALDGFARIVKAKRELAQRQRARDAYLDESAAVAEAAHEDASARVIAAFLRSTGARRAVRSRADAINEYNDARELQEAASSPSLSPSATAAGSDAIVMSAGEAGSEAGSEACHAPLDEHPTPRPDAQRPLTAQQIAEERAELDRLATAEEVERQKELSHHVMNGPSHAFHQLRPSLLECDGGYESNSTASSSCSVMPAAREQRHPTSAEARACLRGFVQIIRDRKELRRRQASRDAHLPQYDNGEINEEDGVSVTSGAAATARRTPEKAEDVPSFHDLDGICEIYREERTNYAVKLLDGFCRSIKAKRELAQRQRARDAYLDESAAVAETAHEDASARVIAAFLRSTGARRAVRSRADAINEYNDARELQEAASSPSLSPSASAAGSDAVVMSAGEAGSEAGSEACHAPLDEHPTPRPDAQRPLTAQQIAEERAELDRLAAAEEKIAVEELLHTAALTVQRVYRGHRARAQAAMAIVKRDLYLLALQDQTDGDATAGTGEADCASPHSQSQELSLTEGRVNSAAPLGTYADNEISSTPVVVEVDETAENDLDELF
ncbi:hypothetical protein NQL31_004808 [Lotmaria passim]